MTQYAGEQIRVSAVAREYSTAGVPGDLITNANVISVKITILNQDQTVRIADADMTWNSTQSLWEYKWDTADGSPAVTAGTYRYRITVIGEDNKPSIEWGRIRLSRQPAVAP